MRRRLAGHLCVSLLLLAGCWSRTEVNDLGVVLGVAVDIGEERPVRLTLLYARQGQSQQGQSKAIGGDPIYVAAREADNLSDAMREIALAAGRETSLHHVRVVLISEEYARTRGIRNLLDFLARHPQVRMSLVPLVVEGRAQTVLETPPQLKALQPQNLVAILEEKGGLRWRLKDFLVARVSETHSGWMYTVSVIQRPAGTPQAPPKEVVVTGSALFFGDRLVRMLSPKETEGLAWLMSKPVRSVITATCPENPDASFSGQVDQGRTTMRPSWEGGRLRIDVAIQGKVDLIRLTCRDDLADVAWRERLEAHLEKDVRERVEGVIETFKSQRVDPVGFGKRVQLNDPAWWLQNGPNWPEIWPEVEVTVTAQISIMQSGLLLKPANLTEKELSE